jgi:hypothetical protein
MVSAQALGIGVAAILQIAGAGDRKIAAAVSICLPKSPVPIIMEEAVSCPPLRSTSRKLSPATPAWFLTLMVRRLSFQSLEPRRALAAMPVGDAFAINDHAAGIQQLSAESEAVAALPDGGYVVAFEGRGHGDLHGIYVRRFDDEGMALDDGEAVLVNATFNGAQYSPSVASFTDGSFVVVWAGRGMGDRYGIFAQWFDENAEKTGDETRINETVGGHQWDPRVAIDTNGRTIVTWHGVGDGDLSGVYVRIFANEADDFDPVTGEVLVHANTNREQAQTDVVTDGAGGFLVTWSSQHVAGSAWSLRVRQFGSDGMPDSTEMAVQEVTTARQTGSSIVRLVTGEYIVAWTDRSGDGDDWDVLARRLNANGQPTGDAFQLNQSDTGQVRDVKLMATPTGGLLAVWATIAGDGSGSQIVAREFDALGGAVDDQFAVHANTAGDQTHASIAGSGGRAVVVWSGSGAGDLGGVFGQPLMVDTTGGVNVAPIIQAIGTQTARRAVPFTLTVMAVDPNGDTLTFELDPSITPASAMITKTSATTAQITWTPTTSDLPSRMFRVVVRDSGNPQLQDTQDFLVNVQQSAGSLS